MAKDKITELIVIILVRAFIITYIFYNIDLIK